ncbi:MAG: galactose mutarotase [Alphaproteobacteria bacterium]|nr:galactose mutarotase [Alphaproteobacteria bacterium]
MISSQTIGSFDGRPVEEVALRSDTGVSVALINWGVVVRDWQVPVAGRPRHVVLGFDGFEPYPGHSPYFGALVGRVANRIKNSCFTLAGKTYALPANEGPNHLHGGPEGIGRKVWDMDVDSAGTAVRFSHVSPDGAMGYPGTVRFEAVYTLKGNKLRLEMAGMPDRPTPISLVQHQYFNLGAADTVLDHSLHLPGAVARTLAGADLIQTGAIVPVANTIDDFLTPRAMRFGAGRGIDYDLNFVLATDRSVNEPVAIVTGEDKALTFKLYSDRPAVQFYNGVGTNVSVPGLGGKRYGKNSGFCLEDQMYPGAVHNPHFPNIVCTPDKPYRHWCEIEIA